MAITKKPEQKITQKERPINEEKALAFIKRASVNQGAISPGAEEKKKPLLLRLWQSEIDQIEAAIEKGSKKQTHSRRKLNRHAWIVEAILEKIDRETK